LGNESVDKQRRSIFSRNNLGRYSVFTGGQFDAVLSDLYRFCEREQVPITAHCVYDGIEAYPKASFDFGAPEYWRAVLEKFPGLHVNLAHFGWSRPEDYLSKSLWSRFVQSLRAASGRPAPVSGGSEPAGKTTWVREIAGMLEQYPNLYADVAHHGVTEDSNIPKFREAYAAMCRDYPGVVQKKLLFGIDWHVIARVDNFSAFRRNYRQVLEDSGLFSSKEMRDFLGVNALRFLGALPPSAKAKDRWSKNWVRLKSFYRKNRIRPPQWFREASRYKEE
jgi:predicted TIM-barrel fold metal-dependent hydrolase